MKISVLGTEYTIEYRNKIQDVLLNDCDGYCDKTSKCIVIGEKENDSELSDFDQYQRKVLRHEITAFTNFHHHTSLTPYKHPLSPQRLLL